MTAEYYSLLQALTLVRQPLKTKNHCVQSLVGPWIYIPESCTKELNNYPMSHSFNEFLTNLNL